MGDWMSSQWEGLTVGAIDAEVRYRIRRWQERGGDYRELARSSERYLEVHRPTVVDARGLADGPCSACQDPWPCGMITHVWAPD